MLETAVREGSHLFEWVHMRTNGEEFPAVVLLTKVEQSGKVIIQATVRDITKRKHTEKTLLEFKTAVQQSVDGIGLADLDGHVSFVNQAWATMHGCSVAESIGRHFGIFHTQEQLETEVNPFNERLLKIGSNEGEVGHVRKDGSVFPVWMSCTLLIGDDQKPFGFMAIARDITEQKQAEKKLLESNEQLEQYAAALQSTNQALAEFNGFAEAATRAKSEFLANMSHEIRTPLTAILGYADIMLDESAGLATWEHAAVIKRNGEHLLGLINDILDLSKVEAGKLQIEPIRCSPVQLMADVISLMRVRAEAKQLKLEADFVGPLPETVFTDPLRLRQILVNLVGNAIKFTDQGEVRLAVQVPSDPGSPRLRFDVTDTGIGMNDEQVGKLFQPFTQVDNSSVRKLGGTGLGLCISKGMAEALGGKIEVRSCLGKGSVFIVTINPGPLDGIPMIQDVQKALLDRPPTTTTIAPSRIDLQGHILLAEDGPDNQRLIDLILRKAGADVTVVENGQLAVDAAIAAREAGKPFDLILMDMQMPIMDGYTATQQLRERGYTAPIVALTAHAMTEDANNCLDAGCDDYATKPIDRQKFLATVASWVTGSREMTDTSNVSTGEGHAAISMFTQ
jgi:PAS domain S-box-containing protein